MSHEGSLRERDIKLGSFRVAAVPLAAVLAAFAVLATPLRAAVPEDLIFERLGSERGFPSETITALYRDRAGFLWVGSRKGLAVWDGYAVRTFEHEVGNADSLPDNSVRTIYQDRGGGLWVGTNSGGLARLDLATGRFRTFRRSPADAKSLSTCCGSSGSGSIRTWAFRIPSPSSTCGG